MASFRIGAVVLVKFPFTDATASKRRPALVLLDCGDDDLLLARITTQLSESPSDCELKKWSQAGLKATSYVRLHKLATLEKSLIEKELGSLSPEDFHRVRAVWQTMNDAILKPDAT